MVLIAGFFERFFATATNGDATAFCRKGERDSQTNTCTTTGYECRFALQFHCQESQKECEGLSNMLRGKRAAEGCYSNACSGLRN